MIERRRWLNLLLPPIIVVCVAAIDATVLEGKPSVDTSVPASA
jgi:hypothetical protein